MPSAKAGGADPVTNSKLAELMKQAKEAGVPREIVDRACKRAADKNQADYQELKYEAYGPGGTGFVVTCLTDNVNRTAGEVKSAIVKGGGKVAEPGSVLFNFALMGRVVVSGGSEDAVFEAAMEAGAEDITPLTGDEEDEVDQRPDVYKVRWMGGWVEGWVGGWRAWSVESNMTCSSAVKPDHPPGCRGASSPNHCR